MKPFFYIPLCCCLAGHALAQTITVSGRVTDRRGDNTQLINIMVVNQRSGNGTFANPDGTFTIKTQRTDTLLITARDFGIKKLCFADSSAAKHAFTVQVHLDSLIYQLPAVYIHPQPTLHNIHNQISNLGQIPNTDTYKDASPMSPITLLYERFSKIERAKRKVAQLEDDEKRREVLKNLLHLYIKYDIIQLSDNSFDNFIDYCNLTDSFIKQATDYELVMYIKRRYESYEHLSSRPATSYPHTNYQPVAPQHIDYKHIKYQPIDTNRFTR